MINCKRIRIVFFKVILCMGISFACGAQTLSPSVIPAMGGYYTTPSGSLSWTVGETMVQTLTDGSRILTQGFQQPEIQVRTGVLNGPFCQGGNITVPFTASGITGVGNSFIAQLSDAAGSFSTPVTIGSLNGTATSGNIAAVIPPATPIGNAYRIRVVSTHPVFTGPDNGNNLSISGSCMATVNLTLFIEGYYAGAGQMSPVLMNQGVSMNPVVADSITVELHDTMAPFASVSSLKVLLNTNGTANCNFPVSTGSYFLVVKHRNALETWTASPVSLGPNPVSYSFSTSASQAYGSNLLAVGPGIYALYSGDLNRDENIDLIDLSFLENDINAFQFGYFATDINGDGNVDLLDLPLLETHINEFVYAIHP